MKNRIRMISVLAAAVLMASVVVTPAAAAKERNDRADRGRGAAPVPQAQYLDAEIRVIGGQPVLTVEGDAGRTSYEFPWPEVALVDGAEVALVRQGNYFLLPTADGVERVSIEDFEVAVVAGQLMLMTQVNPWFGIPIAVAVAALVKAGVAITAATIKAASILIVAGKSVTARTVSAVIAAWPTIRLALRVAGAGYTAYRVGRASIAWLRGNCISCGRPTSDGATGDLYCPGTRAWTGRQFWLPDLF